MGPGVSAPYSHAGRGDTLGLNLTLPGSCVIFSKPADLYESVFSLKIKTMKTVPAPTHSTVVLKPTTDTSAWCIPQNGPSLPALATGSRVLLGSHFSLSLWAPVITNLQGQIPARPCTSRPYYYQEIPKNLKSQSCYREAGPARTRDTHLSLLTAHSDRCLGAHREFPGCPILSDVSPWLCLPPKQLPRTGCQASRACPSPASPH